MEGLETKVREALIEQRAEELYKSTSENPEYKVIATELMENFVNSLVSSLINSLGKFDEKEKQEMMQEYKAEFLPQIKAQFENPKQFKEMIYEQVKNQLMSYRQLKAKLKSHFTDLRKDEEIGEDVAKEYEKTYEGLFKFAKTSDKIVKELIKIAEKEGLEKATRKETRYTVIRKLFPTAEEYKQFSIKGLEEVRKFMHQAQNTLMADGETGKLMAGMFGAMSDLLEKAVDTTEKVQGKYLEKTIQEIYK